MVAPHETPEIRQNPFRDRGQWYWRSETQHINGPYRTQIEALEALCRHVDPRSPLQRLWAAWLEFIRS